MSDTPQAPPTPDRRRFLRAPLIIQRISVQDERRPFFGYATNISRGGLFIGATNPRERGSRFKLVIPLPEPLDRTVTCTSEVVWRRTWSKNSTQKPGMGMKFLDLPVEEGDAIERWIEESLPPTSRRRPD